jgi:hypothetical protein
MSQVIDNRVGRIGFAVRLRTRPFSGTKRNPHLDERFC